MELEYEAFNAILLEGERDLAKPWKGSGISWLNAVLELFEVDTAPDICEEFAVLDADTVGAAPKRGNSSSPVVDGIVVHLVIPHARDS